MLHILAKIASTDTNLIYWSTTNKIKMYTLESPVHQMAGMWQTALTFTPMGYLVSPVNLTPKFLRTHAENRSTNSTRKGIKPRTFLLWGNKAHHCITRLTASLRSLWTVTLNYNPCLLSLSEASLQPANLIRHRLLPDSTSDGSCLIDQCSTSLLQVFEVARSPLVSMYPLTDAWIHTYAENYSSSFSFLMHGALNNSVSIRRNQSMPFGALFI